MSFIFNIIVIQLLGKLLVNISLNLSPGQEQQRIFKAVYPMDNERNSQNVSE